MSSGKFIAMAVMILGLACNPTFLQADETLPVLQGVRVFRLGSDIGVEISADKKFEYSCSKMPQLLRVVIDLPGTEPGVLEPLYRYKGALVSSIRLEKKSINYVELTRVSVDLAEDAEYTVRSNPQDKTKLTLMFQKAAPGATAGAAAAKAASMQAAPAAAKPAPAQTEPTAAKAAAQPAPVAKPMPTPAMARAGQPVTVTGVSCSADAIEIQSSGSINEFKAFTLQHPARLVVDIPDARTTVRSISIPANGFGVVKARTGIFEGKLRLVFEGGSRPFPAYEVVKTGTGLRIVSKGLAELK